MVAFNNPLHCALYFSFYSSFFVPCEFFSSSPKTFRLCTVPYFPIYDCHRLALKPFKPFLMSRQRRFYGKVGECCGRSNLWKKLDLFLLPLDRQENCSNLTDLKLHLMCVCMSEYITFRHNKTNKSKSNIFFALQLLLRFLSVCGYLTIVDKGCV